MAEYDSASCLAQVRSELRQPTTADFPLDADIYNWLSQAQSEVMFRLGVIVPDSQYGALTLLTSSDGGLTYTFGQDADLNNIVPIGAVEIYRTPQSCPDSPCSPYTDFLVRGDRIEIPNGRAWSGPGPYARFINPPLKITALVAPVLKPVQARQCLIHYAASRGWRVLKNTEEAALQNADFERTYARSALALRTQFNAQNAEAGLNAGGFWGAEFGYGSPAR